MKVFVADLLNLLLAAWLVMLLVPTFTPVAPGYWTVVAAILVVRLVLPGAGRSYWSEGPES